MPPFAEQELTQTDVHKPESEFGLKDGLALQAGALTNKEMVEIALQLHHMNVEDLVPEVQRQAARQQPHCHSNVHTHWTKK